jgi:monoamine oxidase
MKETDIIIIGAGAAGLMCARELLKAGKTVMILEARNRAGGRIHTITDDNFPLPVELGAEFVHGELAVTKKIAREAEAKLYQTRGDLWRSEKGQFIEQKDFIEETDEVIKRLKQLPDDISVADFLDLHFAGEKYLMLRKTLKGYVEGYDAADSKLASSFALLQELIGEDDKQFRIKTGYITLIDYLAEECMKAGCIINLQTAVKEISWKKGQVQVLDQNGNRFDTNRVVVTVPLGVLQSSEKTSGYIRFSPQINEMQEAINSLGFGSVIKVSLNFDEQIWRLAGNIDAVKKSDPGFVFSDAIIPTWWTQIPEKNGMITGWLAGPNATRLQNEPDEKIIHLALESLAIIFQIPRKTLQAKLSGSFVHNWWLDDFSKGAYSYETVTSKKAKTIITTPIEETLYFAGEACYEGPESGTVEAALISGQKAAEKICKLKTC